METSRKSKILIVDDVAKNIQVVASILSEEGYLMTFARSGKIALELADENSFDLILLDIMMPEMDGFQVCTSLKSNRATREVPIIFLTAKVDTESIVRAFEMGGVDYVTKPFNAAELKARVKTHIALKQTVEQLRVEIDERRRSQEALQRSELQLKELVATKDKFFSIISHDLKNPFNTLIGFSDLLLARLHLLSTEKINDYAVQINRAAKNGFNLLENLLQWSRSQTGKIVWKPEPFRLKKLIEDNLALLNPSAIKKNIRLQAEYQDDIFVFVDINMVTTVVRNLISNAIKFTNNEGEINLTVSHKAEECFVTICVSDNGVGIDAEDLNKLFRIDVHHVTTGTAQEQGTGLGLILCKEFVLKNGGTIWVESEIDKGSRFYFTVPKAK